MRTVARIFYRYACVADAACGVEWTNDSRHDLSSVSFIAGVAFPFSLAKQRARGFGRKRILDRIFRRGLILALLGMVYNGLFELNFSSLRIASVLGRIGLAWMFAALLCVYCSVRTRIAVAGIILIGYSLLLGLVVAPDAPVGADPLSVEGCLAGWIDRQYLPGHILTGHSIRKGY